MSVERNYYYVLFFPSLINSLVSQLNRKYRRLADAIPVFGEQAQMNLVQNNFFLFI